MKKLVACLALVVACGAQADTTLDYNVLHAGKKSGAQKTVIQDDGRSARQLLLPRQRPRAGHRGGHRAPARRQLQELPPDRQDDLRRDPRRAFLDLGQAGELAVAGGTRQPGADGTGRLPAGLRQPGNERHHRARDAEGGRRLAALPGGELRSEKLATARVGPAGGERDVALFAILGAGLQPDYVWLEAGDDMPLFASINVGGSHMVVAGYEGVTPELERLQQQAETKYLEDLAKKYTQALPQPILIRNVRVFDAKSKALGEPADVYVNEGRIAAIYPAGSPAKDPATVIDGAGRALLPGLFDMHSHEDAWNAALQIAGGVTSSRDMGNDNDYLARLKADIAAGRAIGPHIEPAGYIEGEGPFASRGGFVVASVAEAENAVDWYAERGFRQVKLYNSIKPEWAAADRRLCALPRAARQRPRARVLALRARRARGLRRTAAHQPAHAELHLGSGHRLAHDRALQPGRRAHAGTSTSTRRPCATSSPCSPSARRSSTRPWRPSRAPGTSSRATWTRPWPRSPITCPSRPSAASARTRPTSAAASSRSTAPRGSA